MKKVVSGGESLQLSDDDRYTLKRYDDFRAAAEYVAAAIAGVQAVKRVALFGSVASSPSLESRRWKRGQIHEPKDVDLAVWLDGVADLDGLRKLSARALQRLWQEKEAGVAHHQVDMFLFDATDRYLGRLCQFNQCPKQKPECRAEGCGRIAFLQQHDEFVVDADARSPERIEILYDQS